MVKYLILALLLGGASGVTAQTISVQWVLVNGLDGSPLPSAQLVVDGDTLTTDSSGFVSTMHPKVSQTLLVHLQGSTLTLVRDTFTVDTSLEYQQFTLEAIPAQTTTKPHNADMVVLASREELHLRKDVSKVTVSRSEMREVAAVQNDPLQVLRTLPGVTNQNDANSRPYVRGGDWWETRVFWNGVPVVQPFHALSLYSIFNMETIDDMSFYSGGFPVENSNSLSGALLLRSRPAPLDSFGFWTQISMLKGHVWTGIPVVKDKFGVSVAYQSFWYDWFIKRTMDVTKWSVGDSSFTQNVNQYESMVELPNFKDLELSANWAITPQLRWDYTFLYAQDIFKVMEPSTDILNSGSTTDTAESDPLAGLKQVDTLAFVRIPNMMHASNLSWNLSSRWDMKLTTALQTQEWQVKFADQTDRPLYDYQRDNFHIRLQNLLQFNSAHLFNFGLMTEWDKVDYDVYLPRFAYELMMQSNVDMMENLAFFEPKGIVMIQGDNYRSLDDMSSTLVMDYKGARTRRQYGTWFSDNWTIDAKNRVTLGSRLDYESSSNSAFLSPRTSWFHKIDRSHEVSVSAGLYSQDNFEFYYRDINPKLASEKAVHFNVEYSWDITPDYKLEFSNYAKYYYDLATPHLRSTGTIAENDLINGVEQMMHVSESDLYSIVRSLDSTVSSLDDSTLRRVLGEDMYQSVLDSYGNKTLAFDNQGIGYAYGTEARFHYDPTEVWRGWVSFEASVSKRKDEENGPWYNFRKHRPWSLKWQNYFDMPGAWELSFRMEYSAGLVYTGYRYNNVVDEWDAKVGDTLMVVEQKNNRYYSPYFKGDIRLEKNSKLFGHPTMFFFEVWNATNEPNFILTDSKTGAIKFFDLNYPFPIVFLGYEFRW